ncbi:CocE/NonD family hydrolase [Pseudonocardiaceae bacterium YIM PH 21723]|nr:CocE/NonD family hydrolase [Pseudonocardiaceae bacterium YIM PH 21723]
MGLYPFHRVDTISPARRSVVGMKVLQVTAVLVALLSGLITPSAAADPGQPVSYDVGVRRDVPVTMSDGTVLRADLYFPTELGTDTAAPGPFPVLLTQSPYGKWQEVEKLPNLVFSRQDYFVQRGYIEVVADVRGQGASEGEFGFWSPIQAQDGADLVNWAATLPNSTGTVGTYGSSYLGMNQLFTAAAVGRNSPLKAIAPSVAAHDLLRDAATMGGLWHLPTMATYMTGTPALSVINPLANAGWDGLRGSTVDVPAALRRTTEHLWNARKTTPPLVGQLLTGTGDTAYDGPLWSAMRPGDQLRQIVDNGVPALMFGGWNDVFQRGALLNYAGLQNAAAGRPVHAPMVAGQPVTGRYQLVYGSGNHANAAGPVDVRRMHLDWFDRWLKNRHNGVDDTRNPLRANVYGTDEWINTDRYPFTSEDPTRLYLSGDHRLTPAPGEHGADHLIYNPVNVGCGRNLDQWTLGAVRLPGDLWLGSELTKHLDVCSRDDRITQAGSLTYTTEPLPEDRLLAGPMSATLQATATTTNTAFVVNIQDIAPDGTSRPLTEGGLDGRSRVLNPDRTWRAANGAVTMPYRDMTAASEQPVVPGELTEYVVEIFPTLARIPAGHRIRVTVGTADFPMILPNATQLKDLAGGRYALSWGSYVDLPLMRY